MGKRYFMLILLFVCVQATGQDKASTYRTTNQLNEKTIVKDTSGSLIAYPVWRQLLATGHYTLRPQNPKVENAEYVISRLTEEEYQRKMITIPKPRESEFFKTGSRFNYFRAKDMNGNKISEKSLEGKILVLNYWFINCPPCRSEIPELNKLVEQYKDDSTIVFVAVGLDDKSSIKQFLKTNPYNYQIIDEGRYIAKENNVSGYPTNVIVDNNGKVYFHSSGFGNNLMHWLSKSIEEIKLSMQPKETPAQQ